MLIINAMRVTLTSNLTQLPITIYVLRAHGLDTFLASARIVPMSFGRITRPPMKILPPKSPQPDRSPRQPAFYDKIKRFLDIPINDVNVSALQSLQ